MKKFYLFMLMAVGLLISGNAWAYTGTGTENDPYLVDNATDLKTLVKNYGGFIQLLDNIDNIGNASLSIAKAVTLNLNGKRLINQTNSATSSVINITATGEVVIKNGTIIRANGTKKGVIWDGSGSCITINGASAEVSLEGLTIGSNDQTTGDNRHLHYGINLKTVKSLKISEDVYFNGAKSSGSDIMIGNAATTEVIIGEIYNESKATILINATSAAKYESGYRPIRIGKISKNNGEIYAKFQSKIDDIDENACAEGGKIFICENSFVPAGKWEDWVSKGYIDTQKYTFTTDGLVVADAGYYKVVDASNCVVEVIKGQTSQKYFAFDAAYNSIAAGETATVKILKSSLDLPDGYHLDVTENRNITLDLNGKTIRTVGGQSGDYFIKIDGGTLSITGNGTINAHPWTNANSYESVIYLYGSSNKDAEDYSVLNVGEGVKFINTGDNVDLNCLIAIFGSQGSEYAYGVKVNFDGTAMKFDNPSDPEPGCMGFMTINGTATAHETNNYPHITIGEKAKIYAEKIGIYAAGFGNWTIENGATIVAGLSAIEIRAGELNVEGGKMVSTYVGSESESWGNGNGTTTVGAGIAVAQHTTKQPITVTISGGDIDGIIPVKLANPQSNPDEYINTVRVDINGGRYKVTNNASAPFWSITDKFYVSAGKFSHVPAYVVEGKTVIPNPDDDKDIYPWTIGEVNETPVKPDDNTNITWQTATDWENNEVPASVDNVVIGANQNVVVSGTTDEVAQAYSITIPEGSTLTVESGATLVVGGGGITNADGATGLQVEPGAQVIVSPDADMTGLYGRVALTPNVGKYPTEMVGVWYNKPNRYQLVGIPTKGAPDAITKNKDDGDGFKLNQWDVMTGWKAANLDDFSVPFKGFFFWNDVATSETEDDRVTYYFKGELFGNKPQTLVFTEHEGFHLFANSYLAEVDIMALIQGAEEDVQKAVYVYDPVSEKFTDISYATYGKPGIPSAIQPMQGFYFLNQHDANTTAPMDYVSMVWSNAFKVDQEFVPTNAPRKSAIDGSEVRINITDNVVGRTDGVYVMEDDKYSAELDGSDIQKMMNPATSVNIYATTPVGNLSTMQTNDIENQYLTIETNAASMYTMSFDWVAGDELYLLDTYNGKTTLMTEGNTYEFAAQPKSIINDRFQIVKTAAQAPTTIENVKSIKAVKGTYTVTGQCLGENVDWNKLPQGVYVIDGVKVVK